MQNFEQAFSFISTEISNTYKICQSVLKQPFEFLTENREIYILEYHMFPNYEVLCLHENKHQNYIDSHFDLPAKSRADEKHAL